MTFTLGKSRFKAMKRTIAMLLGTAAILVTAVLIPGEALAKYRCSDFSTCEEAMKALKAGATYLDRDGDGVPCESLCR
jgi:hypothetical protein